jgi:hypothetical protein
MFIHQYVFISSDTCLLWNSGERLLREVVLREVVLREVVDTNFSQSLTTIFLKDANFVDTSRLMSAVCQYARTNYLRSNGLIAGRVDNYAVPLRSGSTYILELRLDQFWSPSTKEFNLKLKPGHYWVSALFLGTGAETRNSDTTGMNLMHFWKGKLQSNVFEFSE